MGFAAIFGLLQPIFSDLIKRIFPDPQQQAEAEYKMQELLVQAQAEAAKADQIALESKKEVIVTEMNQGGWASQWRSYLMMVCISIVAYNWVIASLLNAFLRPLGVPIEVLAVPPELWTLVTVGLGGYLTKETVNTYQQGKVATAQANNLPNNKAFFDTMRAMFPNGMSAEQVQVMNKALQARDGE